MDSQFTASFLVTKHSWRGKYQRVLSCSSDKLVTMDLKGLFTSTNSWALNSSTVTIEADPENSLSFSLSSLAGGKNKTMLFSCLTAEERIELMTAAHQCRMVHDKSQEKIFHAQTYTFRSAFAPVQLHLTRVGIEEKNEKGNSMRVLLLSHIKWFTTIEGQENLVVIAYRSVLSLFLYKLEKPAEFIQQIVNHAKGYLGMKPITRSPSMSIEHFEADRFGIPNAKLESIAEFNVVRCSEDKKSTERVLFCITKSALVERDPETYLIISAMHTMYINSIVRCCDDDQKFLIEYVNPRVIVEYTAPMRDSIVGQIYSASKYDKNESVSIVSLLPRRSMRFGVPGNPIADEVESSLLFYIVHPEKLESVSEPTIALAVEYFNANVSYAGLRFAENKEGIFSENRERLVQDALYAVLSNYPQVSKAEVVVNRLACLRRLCLSRAAYTMIANSSAVFGMVSNVLLSSLRQEKHDVLKEVLDFLSVLVVSHHNNYDLRHEMTVKNNILSIPNLISSLMNVFRRLIGDDNSVIVLQSLLQLLVYLIAPPYSESTYGHLFVKVVGEIVERTGSDLFSLFNSTCINVQINAARIMKAILEEGDAVQFELLKNGALSEGGFLKQFHLAAFSPNKEQRDLARCLISYWVYKNSEIQDLLRRMVPVSLLLMLQSKEVAAEEEQWKENQRLFDPITEEYKDSRKSWIEKALKQAANRGGEVSKEEPLTLRPRNIRIKPSLNWPMFFAGLSGDHRQPHLIWNHNTRSELRHALENELTLFQLTEKQRGSGTQKIAWNYLEFEVPYPSLAKEVRIGNHYPRLLFEQKAPEISRPKEFFFDIYHRFLLASEEEEKVFCLQCMTVLLTHYAEAIGEFHDIPFFVSMLHETQNPVFRDSLVGFFFQLLNARCNIKLFVDSEVPAALAELLPLAHLHVDRPHTSVISNAIEQNTQDGEDESIEEEQAWYFQADDSKMGPFSYRKIKSLYKEGTIGPHTKMWAQGLSGWKPMVEITQLKWGVLCSDKPSTFNLSELTTKILDIFLKLCRYYPSKDVNGALMSPLPKVKRFLSGPAHLPHLVQLLLSFDPSVCSRVHLLLCDLMDSNPVVSRLYCTGAFFFALLYNGSDVLPLLSFIRQTHLHQSYKYLETSHKMVQSSILAPLLPPSMVCALQNHEPQEYARIFLGENETPEVVWSSAMRSFMMSKIAVHVAEFSTRLRSNIYASYSYCPIATIVYESLKKEIFCYEYYLEHLCDTAKFPDWPIRDAVQFLSELLQLWKDTIGVKPTAWTCTRCYEELEITPPEDDAQSVPLEVVRQAYLKLVPVYHPDKNPNGREKFEGIQRAYEFLASDHASSVSEEQKREILFLVLRAQTILYERCGEALSHFKYAGFHPLLTLLKQEVEDPMVFHKSPSLLKAATELCHTTIKNIPLNADELQEAQGIPVMVSVLRRCFDHINSETEGHLLQVRAATHCMGAFAAAALLEDCRAPLKEEVGFAQMLVGALSLSKALPLRKNAIDVCAVISLDPALRHELIGEGALWYLTRLLFLYDPTMEAAKVQLDEVNHTQCLKNHSASASLHALKRIIFEPTQDPTLLEYLEHLQAGFATLLTPFITQKIKENPSDGGKEELRLLVTNTENPYLVWNSSTRAELLAFVDKCCEDCRYNKSIESFCEAMNDFVYTAHQNLLQVGNLFVSLYAASPTFPIEDPHTFWNDLAAFVAEKREEDEGGKPVSAEDLTFAVKALRALLVNYPDVAVSAACASVKSLLTLLSAKRKNAPLNDALELFKDLLSFQPFTMAVAQTALLPVLFGRLLFSERKELMSSVLQILHHSLDTRDLVEQTLTHKLHVLLLAVLFDGGRTQLEKEQCASVLSLAFSDKLFGPEIYHSCATFLPRVLLDAIRDNWRLAMQLFTTWQENPELQWTEERKKKTEKQLATATQQILAFWESKLQTDPASAPSTAQLKLEERKQSNMIDELCVGGVYLKSYEKHPGWVVRSPKEFAIGLMERFLVEAGKETAESSAPMDEVSLLPLLTSSMLQVLRNSPFLVDQLSTLGYFPKFLVLLSSKKEQTAVAALKWLYMLGSSPRAVEVLSKHLVMRELYQFSLKYPKNSLLQLQVVQQMASHSTQSCSILQQSLDFHIVEQLLKILEHSSRNADSNEDPAVIRALVIKILKQLQSLPEPLFVSSLNTLLEKNSLWKKYKDHSHDLFLRNTGQAIGSLLESNVSGPTLYLEGSQSPPSEPPTVA